MKVSFTALVIFLLSVSTLAGTKKDVPKVAAQKLEKVNVKESLFYPLSVRSEVDAKIKADSKTIIIKRIASLGSQVKRGEPLLEIRNQDMSSHYENRVVRSPVSGVVSSYAASVGQYMSPGEVMVTINDPARLYGMIEVPASDVKKLKIGLETNLNVNSLDIKDLKTTISAIGSVADFSTGTISVELSFTKEQSKSLVAGTFGMAEVYLDNKNLLLVPEKSLYYVGDDILIPIVKDSTIKKTSIKLGKRYKDKVEIIEGVNLLDEYVLDSPTFLKDGSSVEVLKK